MSSETRPGGSRVAAGLAGLLALGALLILSALALGLLELFGAVVVHGRHGPIHTRPLPVPRAALLGLVYGLIPVVSAAAILAAFRGRSRRTDAKT